MSNHTNFAFSAAGKIFELDASITIVVNNNEKLILGELDTSRAKIKDLLNNNELGVNGLSGQFTLFNSLPGTFKAQVLKSAAIWSVVIQYNKNVAGVKASLYVNAVVLADTKQLALSIDTNFFRDGNVLEQFIYDTMTFFAIKKVALIVRNKSSLAINQYLKRTASDYFPEMILSDRFNNYQLVANSLFDLKNSDSAFGKGLYQLTGLDHIDLIIGAALNTSKFEAMLVSANIKKEGYEIENLYFGIKNDNGFYLEAGGKLNFPLKDDVLTFVLAGNLSVSSFTLSASSNYKIPLNTRISLSDLGLMIGVGATGVTFGMTGRVTTDNISIFAGFIVSQANIGLITAAITSTKGRTSLKDIIVDIAEVDFPGIEFLDVVALADFEINNAKMPQWNPENASKAEILNNFNSNLPTELAIPGVENLQVSALGNSRQAIFTDTSTMRHYRVDSSGAISLNCQLFICTQPTRIGNYQMNIGFFLCGTIEIFNVKARGLFLIEPGNAILALIEISKIEIKGIFELTRSRKTMPMEPVEGGLAGALIKADAQGPVLYLNINRASKKLEFYLSAYVNILNIFQLDALILLKDRKVYIDLELQYVGFKILFHLDGNYADFSSSGFNSRLVFDTSGFIKLLEEAQNAVRDAAKSVQNSIENANRKLTEAQQQILNLSNTINEYNNYILGYIDRREDASWWRVDEKIYYSAQILYYETLKVGVNVAIGVAYGALEIAKAALTLGGKIASGALEAVANILGAITKLLWIKSFVLSMEFTANARKIEAELELTVFGNDITLKGSLDIDKAMNDIGALVTGFVKDKLSAKTQEVTSNIGNGIFRTLSSETDYNLLTPKLQSIAQNKKDYYDLLEFHDMIEDFLIESNKKYVDEYEKQPEDWQQNICEIEEVKLKNEVIQRQCVEAFDDEFVSSLDDVITLVRDNQVRASISSEMDQQMTDLLGLVRDINNQKTVARSLRSERRSLFSSVENVIEDNNEVKRSFKANSDFDIDQANENYADGLSELLKKTFPDTTNEYGEEFKDAVAAAIYQFRNPPQVNPRR
ncbi:hypothetical protein SAMN05421827_13032 [Pedobacter terrae]|uniref:Uncharacterized protein n=1 Tax=Pedobacter terrae TaxID=405671 RepID=A0A1G8DN30_9SPHI|nr:hypothetical protein [Pedobacter terrae]SDH59103.1 hypothetical protein SAMN05421827_13032 [Pedobacter terrae]